MSVLNKIKAYLYRTATTSAPNDYTTRTAHERSLSIRYICEAAVSRRETQLSALTMEHTVSLFFQELAYQLCDGYSLNTWYFTANAQIRGVFDSPNETYDSKKHNTLFLFNQRKKVRNGIPNIQIDILKVTDSSAIIIQVTDIKSGSVNDLLTPGRNLKIIGNKLKVTGDNPNVGVYFVETSSQMKLPVDADDLVTNNPSELIIVIPALPQGTYTIQVVTQFTGGSFLEEPQTAVFDKVLTVQ